MFNVQARSYCRKSLRRKMKWNNLSARVFLENRFWREDHLFSHVLHTRLIVRRGLLQYYAYSGSDQSPIESEERTLAHTLVCFLFYLGVFTCRLVTGLELTHLVPLQYADLFSRQKDVISSCYSSLKNTDRQSWS